MVVLGHGEWLVRSSGDLGGCVGYDFNLPYRAKVVNLKTGLEVPVKNEGKIISLDMEAGESRWYSFTPRN
jgi:hypothetical protein